VGRSEAEEGVAACGVGADRGGVVRRVFAGLGEERGSLAAVSQRLGEAGGHSPTGKARWSRSMIGILRANSAYAGEARFGKNASIPWQPPLRPGRSPPRRRPLTPKPMPRLRRPKH